MITSLKSFEIFVFGSNLAGRHGAGAARQALKFGARYGVGEGVCGQTYAIPTKDRDLKPLQLTEIEKHVSKFLDHAAMFPKLVFLVTPIGCGLAGYEPRQIAPFFSRVFNVTESNVMLPPEFTEILDIPL